MSLFTLISQSENATNPFDEYVWDSVSVYVGSGLVIHAYQTGCDLTYCIHDASGTCLKLISLDLCFEATMTEKQLLEAAYSVEECPFM